MKLFIKIKTPTLDLFFFKFVLSYYRINKKKKIL